MNLKKLYCKLRRKHAFEKTQEVIETDVIGRTIPIFQCKRCGKRVFTL